MLFSIFFAIFPSDVNIWVRDTIETNRRTADTLYTCFKACVLDANQKPVISDAHVSTRDLNLKDFNVTKDHFQDPQKMIENNQTRLFFSTLFGLKDQLCAYWELSGTPGKKGEVQAIWCGRDTLKQFTHNFFGQKTYVENICPLWRPDAPHVTCDITGKKKYTVLLHSFSMDGISYEQWYQNHYQTFIEALAVKVQSEKKKTQKNQAELNSKNRQLKDAHAANQILFKRCKSAADIERRFENYKKTSQIERSKASNAQDMLSKIAHEAKVAHDKLKKSEKRAKSVQSRNNHLELTIEELKAQVDLWKIMAAANKKNKNELVPDTKSRLNSKGRNVTFRSGPENPGTQEQQPHRGRSQNSPAHQTMDEANKKDGNVSVSPGPENPQAQGQQVHRGRSQNPKKNPDIQKTTSPGGLFSSIRKGFLISGNPRVGAKPEVSNTNTNPSNKITTEPKATDYSTAQPQQVDLDSIINNPNFDIVEQITKIEIEVADQIIIAVNKMSPDLGVANFKKWYEFLMSHDNPLSGMDIERFLFSSRCYRGKGVINAFILLAEKLYNSTPQKHAEGIEICSCLKNAREWLDTIKCRSPSVVMPHELPQIQASIQRIDSLLDIWNVNKSKLVDAQKLSHTEKRASNAPNKIMPPEKIDSCFSTKIPELVSTQTAKMASIINTPSIDLEKKLTDVAKIASTILELINKNYPSVLAVPLFKKWHDFAMIQDDTNHPLNLNSCLLPIGLFFQEQSYTGQRVIAAFIDLAEKLNADVYKQNQTVYPHAETMRSLFESTQKWLHRMDQLSVFQNKGIQPKIQSAMIRIDWILGIWDGKKPHVIDCTEFCQDMDNHKKI